MRAGADRTAVFKVELALATRETFAPGRVADIRGKSGFRPVLWVGHWKRSRRTERERERYGAMRIERKPLPFHGTGLHIIGGSRGPNPHGFRPTSSLAKDRAGEIW